MTTVRRIPGAKPARDEEMLQRAIWQLIQLEGNPNAIAYAVPNGTYKSKAAAGRQKAMGLRAGVPDLAFVLPDGGAAFMELKSRTGRVSPEQSAFIATCDAIGVPCPVVSDLENARMILRAWKVIGRAAGLMPGKAGV